MGNNSVKNATKEVKVATKEVKVAIKEVKTATNKDKIETKEHFRRDLFIGRRINAIETDE